VKRNCGIGFSLFVRFSWLRRAVVVVANMIALAPAAASELVTAQMQTNLLPHPLQYTVLLPDGYDPTGPPLPLLFLLHGGTGDNGFLTNVRAVVDSRWAAGSLPKLIAVTPNAERSFYMDFRDGSQKWETLLTGPFLDHLRKTYRIAAGRNVYVMGPSMGGMGSLRLAFKHPDIFAGLAALEPAVDPVFHWKDVLPRHKFYRPQEVLEFIYGKPIDAAYWEANNPASIVNANPDRIRAAGLSIYLDCGDEDSFGLDEAAEFMHQLLLKNRIKHEYHLVHGADHVGRTLRPREAEALDFLGRAINPPPPDPIADQLRKTLAPLREKAQ
jgi:S-formylglutathione hydrolase